MKLSDTALTTIETAKDYLGIPLSDTTQDRALGLLINGASEVVETYSKRRFKKGTYTELYDGPVGDRLFLKGSPIVSITSLSFDSNVQSAGDYVSYGSKGYVFYKGGVYPSGNQNIGVTYIGGYTLPKDATTEVPRDLPYKVELATLMLVDGMFNKKGSGAVSNTNSGGMSVGFEKIFSDDIKALLKPYRYYNV